MSRLYVQSEGTAARRRFPVYLVDATDGITPETGESGGQPQISKVGGAWANTTASVSVQHFAEFTRLKLLILYTRTNTTNF